MNDNMSLSEKIYESLSEGTEILDHDPAWTVLEVCDDEQLFGSGMYAALVDTGDGNCAVVFRGTQPDSALNFLQDVVFADVGLLNNGETAQQEMARKFTNEIYAKYGDRFNEFNFVGHSLGGNLAEHAMITAPAGMRGKSYAVSLDGPGFSQEYLKLHANEIAASDGRLDRYQWSFVGAFLNSPKGENYNHITLNDVDFDPRIPAVSALVNPSLTIPGIAAMMIEYEFRKHQDYQRIKDGQYTEGRMRERDINTASRIVDTLTNVFTDNTKTSDFLEEYCSRLEDQWIKRPGDPGRNTQAVKPVEFEIKTQFLDNAADNLDKLSDKIRSLNEELIAVRKQIMPYRLLSKANLIAISMRLQMELTKCRQLSMSLYEISNTYDEHEEKCVEYTQIAAPKKLPDAIYPESAVRLEYIGTTVVYAGPDFGPTSDIFKKTEPADGLTPLPTHMLVYAGPEKPDIGNIVTPPPVAQLYAGPEKPDIGNIVTPPPVAQLYAGPEIPDIGNIVTPPPVSQLYAGPEIPDIGNIVTPPVAQLYAGPEIPDIGNIVTPPPVSQLYAGPEKPENP